MRYGDCTGIVRDYFSRALGAEPPNTPRRRELLLQRLAFFPNVGAKLDRKRLRSCICCGRPYLGPRKAERRDLDNLCGRCRRESNKTPSRLHKKAIRNASDARYRLRRIYRAQGDRLPPRPAHCQHGKCTNDTRLWLTWTIPTREPQWLCWRHRYYALLNAKHTEPAERGRPAKRKC